MKMNEKYKFKSVKVWSSPEWMADATKKYRSVFDRSETTFIGVEFSFYNKWFDEQDWKAKINLKAIELNKDDRTELCNLEINRDVPMSENVVSVYKSWGNKSTGSYWKKGTYVWEAYIDDKLVGLKKFFIEDVGKVSPGHNPYFDVVSLKVFTGPEDGWRKKKRKYLKTINKITTQYVWLEFSLKNKVKEGYNCEFFFYYYDEAGQLKGKTSATYFIDNDNEGRVFTFESGWGNKVPGSWMDSKYSAEVVFMDTLVGAVTFLTGEKEEEGVNQVVTIPYTHHPDGERGKQPEPGSPQKKDGLDDVLEILNRLIGLEEIKAKVNEHINYLKFLQVRQEKGFEETEKISLHSIFTGNPGTGKTTVVKLLGKIYYHMGLLSKGHVLEVDRSDLVGEYVGQTAPKVKKIIDKARGGILFIDEAYMLKRQGEDDKDFGKEVIEILVKEMSDGPGDIAIMAAGYPKEMDIFITSNPGLKSRFAHYFHFDDYLPDELSRIAEYTCRERGVKLSRGAKDIVRKILTDAYRDRDKTFGNARYANSIIDKGKMNLGLRLIKHPDVRDLSDRELSTIKKEDIESVIRSRSKLMPDIKIDEPLLKLALDELKYLVGLNNIKQELQELAKLVRYYKETGKDVLNRFSLHSVFTGNPGTGKTTVARIVGKIYKALGILERGHVVECDRETLVAGFVGQTAIKTKEIIEQAMGGVLFIDEAYALSQGNGNDFGREAIEIILKSMEDYRGQLSIIVAGYPDNMQQFLISNPGLKSRFDRVYDFKDFTSDELMKIALQMLKRESLNPDNEAKKHLKKYFEAVYPSNDKYFGNARTVRNIIEKAVMKQNLRMASIQANQRTLEQIETLTFDDVKELEIPEPQRQRIGF